MKKRLFIVGVFIYVLASGLLVQCVFLPRFLPALDNGCGLIRKSDAASFHEMAVAQAARIRTKGWSAWQLRPHGESPAGIASAVYALTGVSKPWMMLPVNAVLWAFSAWLLLLILQPLAGSFGRAELCALPFILAPSSLLFLAQMHKDPFVIAGTLLLWLVLIRLVDRRNRPRPTRQTVYDLAWMAGGLFLLWIGRPYSMFLALLGYAAVGMILLAADLVQRRFSAALWCVLALSVLMCFGLSRTTASQAYSDAGLTTPTMSHPDGMYPAAYIPPGLFRSSCLGPLDAPFRRMAVMRNVYLKSYPDALSAMDKDAVLDSAWRVIAYVPRAMQLMFFAPFPSSWIHPKASTLVYELLYAETAVRYLLLPGLVWLCWRKRRNPAFWIPWVFFVPWGLIYTITTPNLGTLARVRFSLVMLLASLGAAGTVMLFEEWRNRKHVQ